MLTNLNKHFEYYMIFGAAEIIFIKIKEYILFCITLVLILCDYDNVFMKKLCNEETKLFFGTYNSFNDECINFLIKNINSLIDNKSCAFIKPTRKYIFYNYFSLPKYIDYSNNNDNNDNNDNNNNKIKLIYNNIETFKKDNHYNTTNNKKYVSNIISYANNKNRNNTNNRNEIDNFKIIDDDDEYPIIPIKSVKNTDKDIGEQDVPTLNIKINDEYKIRYTQIEQLVVQIDTIKYINKKEYEDQ